MPPPTGVVSGPFIATRKSRIASTVSPGSHSLNVLNAFSPAYTSNHATLLFPPYACSTAASNTRREAFQISRPVPSPSMNGITGESGTCNSPFAYPIARPSAGTASPLYTLFMQVFSQGIAAKPDADTWTAPRPATELGTIPHRTNQ